MLEEPFFSVIIVNYNAGAYLQQCVNSLVGQTFTHFETWIVDNDSHDGSMETLDLSALISSQVIMMGRNSGFAEGNNVAARRANGKWIVLLNADAVAEPDWLQVLHDAIAKYPEAAMFASTQLRMEEKGLLDGVGDGYSAYGFPWRGGYLKPVSSKPDFVGECFGPCGAGAIYRKDVFLKHDGFDERYFCYVEDVDLSFRLRLDGEHCLFLPDAIIHHKGGGLAGEESEFSVFHGSRNRVWTYVGNMPAALLALTLPAHLGLTAFLILKHFGKPYSRYVWRGTKAGWTDAFSFRRERKALRTNRKISIATLCRALTWNIFKVSAHGSAVQKRR